MDIGNAIEKLVAGRWIVGAGIKDAVGASARLNAQGVSAMINYLGENLSDIDDVESTVRVYLNLINEIHKRGVDASIAIKATQIGLTIGIGCAKRNYAKIVGLARRKGVFIWLDMERHRDVDSVIRLYTGAPGKGMVGICIQARLKRSEGDIKRLVKAGAIVRLVKGAYKEDGRVSYTSRAAVTQNYLKLMNYLFRHSKEFMIATHDAGLIREALLLNRSYRRDVTYAMLNGIRNKYAVGLAKRGNKTAIYLPFGERWLDYAFRRLREEGHLSLLIKSLFEGQGV